MLDFGKKLVSAGSLAGTVTSDSVPLLGVKSIDFQAVVAGASSPVGTLQVKFSSDGTNFDSLTGASQAVSGNGSYPIQVIDPPGAFAQIVYTRTSGSGPVDIFVHTVGRT